MKKMLIQFIGEIYKRLDREYQPLVLKDCQSFHGDTKYCYLFDDCVIDSKGNIIRFNVLDEMEIMLLAEACLSGFIDRYSIKMLNVIK